MTADPGFASSIPARSHASVEIDHEIISTTISPFRLLRVCTIAQEMVWLGELARHDHSC